MLSTPPEVIDTDKACTRRSKARRKFIYYEFPDPLIILL